MRNTTFLFMTIVMTAVSAQQKPTTGYAPDYIRKVTDKGRVGKKRKSARC